MSQPVSPLTPIARAFAQLGDPALLGLLARSLLWSVVAFALLAWGVAAAAQSWLGLQGWAAALLGGAGALLASWYLFLPVVAVVSSLFIDSVAGIVERAFYPTLPQGAPAPLATQAWDGLVLGAQVLALQVAGLLLAWAPVAPGLSVVVGWGVAAWAIGRGLFVTVAMRRMPRGQALDLYRSVRPMVLSHGLLIALGSLVPLFNLAVPVLGVAVMVHLLHASTGCPARRVRVNHFG